MNYTGKPRDVMTLAHELGHAVHGMLARGHHYLDFHPVLPLAETASVFGEMLKAGVTVASPLRGCGIDLV